MTFLWFLYERIHDLKKDFIYHSMIQNFQEIFVQCGAGGGELGGWNKLFNIKMVFWWEGVDLSQPQFHSLVLAIKLITSPLPYTGPTSFFRDGNKGQWIFEFNNFRHTNIKDKKKGFNFLQELITVNFKRPRRPRPFKTFSFLRINLVTKTTFPKSHN